jgi:hypothetical protein
MGTIATAVENSTWGIRPGDAHRTGRTGPCRAPSYSLGLGGSFETPTTSVVGAWGLLRDAVRPWRLLRDAPHRRRSSLGAPSRRPLPPWSEVRGSFETPPAATVGGSGLLRDTSRRHRRGFGAPSRRPHRRRSPFGLLRDAPRRRWCASGRPRCSSHPQPPRFPPLSLTAGNYGQPAGGAGGASGVPAAGGVPAGAPALAASFAAFAALALAFASVCASAAFISIWSKKANT